MYLYVCIHLFGEFVVGDKNRVWILTLPTHKASDYLKNSQLDWA